MIRNKIFIFLFFLSSVVGRVAAQDLMDLLKDEKPQTDFAFATFKTTRIVLGQSIESPAKGTLQFLVEHNFGKLNEGAYAMWGLDRSTIRLGLEYGINQWLSVGIGRSSEKKTFDGSAKAKLLRQGKGARNMPVSLSFYGATMLQSLKWADEARKNYFSSRLSYISQLLVARKFSNAFSLQITPTYIHKNLVPFRTDQNDIFSVGIGGRVKVSQRTTLNGEYFYLLPGTAADNYVNCLSVGVDLETGGHVFQFRLTNAQPMFDRAFISETTDKWFDGGIYFGFTINRVFTVN